MELPPRQIFGADSNNLTEHPASLAINAAHKAALPPPMTNTSTEDCLDNGFSFSYLNFKDETMLSKSKKGILSGFHPLG
jgi:hypothetical protein